MSLTASARVASLTLLVGAPLISGSCSEATDVGSADASSSIDGSRARESNNDQDLDAASEMLDGAFSDASSPPDQDASVGDAGLFGVADAAPALPSLPEYCDDERVPPSVLECTGLYADLAEKVLMPNARAYAPAISFWSDNAEKQRWVILPEGEAIDTSDPNEWIFPIGTKFFKEFSVDGRRVETRLWQKENNNFWINAVYAWNENETEAPRSAGGEVPLGDGTYNIPIQEECDKCHRGRTDRILGFEAVSLALPGAQGLPLSRLIEDNLLSDVPDYTELQIPDDGSGLAGPALGWLHTNCGITCHNTNSRAIGFATDMFLRLDPQKLSDGAAVDELDTFLTTMGRDVQTANWRGQLRIDPGQPDTSFLLDLVSARDGDQMPPFATSLVDTENVEILRAWISSLEPTVVVVSDPSEPGDPPLDGGHATAADAGRPLDAGQATAADAGAPTTANGGVDAGSTTDAAAPPDHASDASMPLDASAPSLDGGATHSSGHDAAASPGKVPTADAGPRDSSTHDAG